MKTPSLQTDTHADVSNVFILENKFLPVGFRLDPTLTSNEDNSACKVSSYVP